MKALVFSWFQPVTMVIMVLFWTFAPTTVTHNDWTLLAVNLFITGIVVGMEFVNERHVGWRTNWRESLTDLGYTLFNFTVIPKLVVTLWEHPLQLVKDTLGYSTPWISHFPFALQVAFVIFVVELGGYLMHIAMHHTFLWWSHAPHHHITQMNAMKGAVGNPTELFLISLSVVALFDIPPTTLFCAATIQNLSSLCTHSNVRYNCPRWFTFIFNTIENHSLHHTWSPNWEDTRCNYGGVLIIFDRLFGTFREGESVIVGQDDRKRLSIWEQTIFTFREPMLALKAKKASSSASVPG